jgi:predicted ATPase
MWLKSIKLRNIKSFADSGVPEFSKSINLLVGPNNSGKSAILRSIQMLQPFENSADLGGFFNNYVRLRATEASIELELSEPEPQQLTPNPQFQKIAKNSNIAFAFNRNVGGGVEMKLKLNGNLHSTTFPACISREPTNFMYPYFSRRKPGGFNEQINLKNAQTIEETMQQLPSKLDRLASRRNSTFNSFQRVCQEALGFTVACPYSGGGKQAGLDLEDDSFIPVSAMGEGTLNILVLLVHLAPASGKLFLIEEIENDLHPAALKPLLEFIIEKSKSNQFIISTHSNIVVRHLGSALDAKVFSLKTKLDGTTGIPTSICELVPDNPSDKLELLESLGYEPFDFYLWKGYLILEESTAELVINKVLVPWFFPSLSTRLKTIAASGVGDVERRFQEFRRVFVFVHSAEQYRNRGWVVVDSGDEGEKVVSRLRSAFKKDWPEDHFQCLPAPQFENYYPTHFQEESSRVFQLPHGKNKQDAKGKLAEKVVEWALANRAEAEAQFRESAGDVLQLLGTIDQNLH